MGRILVGGGGQATLPVRRDLKGGYFSTMLNPRTTSVSSLVARLCAYAYRFECVEAKCVGVKVTDHEPSLAGVVVPSSRAEGASRSPLIHTSRRSMFAGSLT